MKVGAENNLLFVGLMLLFVILVVGVNLVDGGLTRLIQPDTPFSTFSISYGHGLVLEGPESQYGIESLPLGFISMGERGIVLETDKYSLGIPCTIDIFSLERLRSVLDILTK